jgi:hypothetical protein
LANNFGLNSLLGFPYFVTNPAPSTVLTIPPGSIGSDTTLTFQGLIADAGSFGPGISLTNAIVLKVE